MIGLLFLSKKLTRYLYFRILRDAIDPIITQFVENLRKQHRLPTGRIFLSLQKDFIDCIYHQNYPNR